MPLVGSPTLGPFSLLVLREMSDAALLAKTKPGDTLHQLLSPDKRIPEFGDLLWAPGPNEWLLPHQILILPPGPERRRLDCARVPDRLVIAVLGMTVRVRPV